MIGGFGIKCYTDILIIQQLSLNSLWMVYYNSILILHKRIVFIWMRKISFLNILIVINDNF